MSIYIIMKTVPKRTNRRQACQTGLQKNEETMQKTAKDNVKGISRRKENENI